MPDTPKLLAQLAGLPPEEAVKYMQQRGLLTETFSWMDLWQEEHATQFTVSRLARLDLLQAVHDGITASVKGDLGRRDFMRGVQDILVSEGWWGEKEVTDPKTGEKLMTRFDPARLKLIYDVNTSQAYSAGLWQRIERNKSTSPYIRYITKRDERVRASHRAWDKLTLPVDHPFWNTHYPPNGWHCRCRAMSMSREDYEKGLTPDGKALNKSEPEIEWVEWKNKKTGTVEKVPKGIDPGFGYNPGIAAQRASNLKKVFADKMDSYPAPIRKAALDSPLVVGDISPDFHRVISTALSELPDRIKSIVASGGYEVAVAKRLTDIKPDLAGKTPRGYTGGETWDNLDGGLLGGTRKIGIAETSIDIETGNLVHTDPARAVAVLRHEYGHALDVIRKLSDDAAYVTAYELDAEALKQWTHALTKNERDQLLYLMQDGENGRQETFAELFAEAHGGGAANLINAAIAFPSAFARVKALLEELLK